jgi:hypothetical protein
MPAPSLQIAGLRTARITPVMFCVTDPSRNKLWLSVPALNPK